MTPYIIKVGSRIVVLLGALGGAAKTIHEVAPQILPTIFAHLWLLAAFAFAAAYTGIFFLALREMRDSGGVYVSVRKLRNMGQLLQHSLRLKEYRDYYGARTEDEDIRERLQKYAVVIIGEPLAGKTRAAIEAVLAVCPRAFLLDIAPDSFTDETVKQIVIPSFWLVRPDVVLFLDDLPRYLGKPFRRLASRLGGQCRLHIIATCRRGPDFEGVTRDAEMRDALGQALAQPVTLGPLDEKLATEIYKGVWAGKAGPVVRDKTLPGYLLGINPEVDYAVLRKELRLILSGLSLARCCGASPCKESLLWSIVEGVFNVTIQDRDAALREMETAGILFVNRKGREDEIEVQHNTYLDEDYSQSYQNADAFILDVKKLETILERSKQAERLATLGVYWKQLHDLPEAERALKRSIELNPEDWRVHVALAGLYAMMSLDDRGATPWELANNAVESAVALLADGDGKANALLIAGDELLYGLARQQEALKLYQRAAELVQNTYLSNRISERRGDALLKLEEFKQAVPIFRNWYSRAFPQERLSAGVRLMIALTGDKQDAEAAKVFQEFWIEAKDTETRFGLATSLLESAEACFALGTRQLRALGDLVLARFLPDKATSPEPKLSDVAEFGGRMVIEGFLWLADQANEYVIANSKRHEISNEYLAMAYVNLGESYRDRLDFDQARIAFTQAQRLATANAKQEPLTLSTQAWSLSGLGDCDLLQNHDLATAENRYQQSLSLIKNLNATTYYATGWASLGLADIYMKKLDYRAAEAAYRKAVVPRSVALETRRALGLARVCRTQRLYEEAQLQVLTGWRKSFRLNYTATRAEFEKEYAALKTARAQGIGSATTAAQ